MNGFGKLSVLALLALLPHSVLGNTDGDADLRPESYAVETPQPATVAVYDGNIYITVPESTTIKIYSILGNLVLEKKIPAGTTQIDLKARGIYLINTGDSIKRIAL